MPAPNPHLEGLPIGALTTHVLDTAHGCPAAGMTVTLARLDPDPETLSTTRLGRNGRTAEPLLDADTYRIGRYRLTFDVARYFLDRGVALPEPPFLDRVSIDFAIAEPDGHYHVPLLVSPWSYSTYRGS